MYHRCGRRLEEHTPPSLISLLFFSFLFLSSLSTSSIASSSLASSEEGERGEEAAPSLVNGQWAHANEDTVSRKGHPLNGGSACE